MPDSVQSRHPSAAQLAAFAQGQFAAAQRAMLQAHLKSCPACRQALAALPGGGESVSGRDTQATTDEPPRDATARQHPGSAVPADLADHPRYEVLQLLGQGGMGAVYKARHKKMDRLVALKVIHARLLDNAKAVERFQREVQAAAKLDHPNIVRAYDADEAGVTHFLVMEFVEGTDLAQYVARKGPLPLAHACHFVRQAALGLQHAHDKGMVHRDVKPHNLMLVQPPGQPAAAMVKVMDFGLARLAREQASEAGLTGENALMGTVDYIAPEQAEDAHRADIRADVYSLGCTLGHLLAGRSLLAGGSVTQKLSAHLTGQLPLADLPAAVPAELRAVLAKMVAKEPAQRYQTPGEVAAALAPFLRKPAAVGQASCLPEASAGKMPAPRPVPAGDKERRRHWRLRAGGGAAVALAVLLAGIVLFRQTPQGKVRLDSTKGSRPASTESPLARTFTNRLGMQFVLVPKGKFLMGGGGRVGTREVTIEQDFYLGRYEVTQEEWHKVTGINPSAFKAVAGVKPEDQKRFPVEAVSWNDCQAFIKLVNEKTQERGWTYRLPTEAEWEYACRGGPSSNPFDYAFDFYFERPTNTLLPEQANFNNSLKRTCKVGNYRPSRLGLYDMHGNVWEWCADETPGDPKDPKAASQRVIRGGSWFDDSGYCRAACRLAKAPSWRHNDLGLRLARVPVGAKDK